jgi:predicted secreted protein
MLGAQCSSISDLMPKTGFAFIVNRDKAGKWRAKLSLSKVDHATNFPGLESKAAGSDLLIRSRLIY